MCDEKMDYGLPIAKRTRLREAQYYKELYGRKKRNGGDSVSGSGLSSSGGKREGSVEVETRVEESVKSRVDSESIAVSDSVDNVEEVEAEVEVIGEIGIGACDKERVDDDSVDSQSLGSKGVAKSNVGFENFDNADPIDVDDEEDDDDDDDDDYDVVVLGEKDDDDVVVLGEEGVDFMNNSNCSNLKTGSGSWSKIGGDKDENLVPIDVDEVVESEQRVSEEGNGMNLNGGKSSGVAEGTQSKLGGLKKSGSVSDIQSVSDVQSIDADELKSSGEEDNDEPGEDNDESEEEDNDDSEDEDYRAGDSFIVVSLEQSSSSDDVEEREDVGDSNGTRKGSDEEGKKISVGVGSKRKSVNELDLLVDCNENRDENESEDNPINVTPEHNCVAQRTRSHFSSRLKKKKIKLGTVSHPHWVDEAEEEVEEDELDSSCGHDDGGGNDIVTRHGGRKRCSNDDNDDVGVQKVGANDEEELGAPTKRKRVRVPKDDALEILVDSILERGEVHLEQFVSSWGETPNQERNPPVVNSLPLKFTFGVDDSNLPEKSADDKQMDQLWAEFDFVLRSCEIGSVASPMVDSEDSISPDVETDQAALCHQGNHHLVLDDQIGVKCKFCSFVKLEIKYIVPSFNTHPWGRSDRKDSCKVDHSIFNELQFHDSGLDSQSGCDPCVHAKGTVWDIIPGIKNSMYPHQSEGFEFIWKNIAGGIYLDKLKKSNSFDGGSGCIISHAPGTGKTRLTIVFLQTYMELYPTCRPVIIAPRTMLLTWEEEFQKWKVDIPFHNLNKPEFSGKENAAAVNFLRQNKHQDRSVKSMRMVKLYSWKTDKSILGISYRLFEQLAGGGDVVNRKRNKKSEVKPCNESEQIRKILLELPGLLVLDEGHTPRNDQSLIWKALSKIETERRVILSGTPFQNNFDELYNTLCLVRPKFDSILFEKYGDFQKKRGRRSSAARGKWASLTSSIGKVADDKVAELRAMIDPFVHVHKGTILQESLPGLRNSVVVLQPAHFQKSLLEGIQGTRNPLELDYLVSLISVHPSLFLKCCLSDKVELFVDKDKLGRLRLNPDAGVKTKFLIELIRLSEAMNEKVLVFSQYIDPLTFIRDQLKSHFKWTEGKEVLYMDGQLDVKQRQSSINIFNDSASEVRVLLASTKACSEGINLVGASRVVLLDVVWNPSVERQAISRAYRLGQKKVVYIYHLITSGTMEWEKYYRQAEKGRLSELVFSSADRDHNGQKISSTVSNDKILEEMVQHDKLKYMFERIIYQPKESNLIETFSLVDLLANT